MGEAKRREEARQESIVEEVQYPDLHPPMHEEDPRAAAERRTAEILGHIGSLDEGTDEFYIDQGIIPSGWDYNWKRLTLGGQEDPAYQVALRRTGWEAVPVSRHPEMMPSGWTGAIIRKGNILMERPMQITELVKERDKKTADNQVKVKEEQVLGQAVANLPQGYEATNKGRQIGRISRSVEPMAVPK